MGPRREKPQQVPPSSMNLNRPLQVQTQPRSSNSPTSLTARGVSGAL